MKTKNHYGAIYNKSNIVRGLIPAFSGLCSMASAFYFFQKTSNIILWGCVFGVFLSFYRFGSAKKQQLYYVLISSIQIFVVMTLAIIISCFAHWLGFLFLFVLIFTVLCMHRYFRGGKVLGVMAAVYILLLHGFFPSPSVSQGIDLLGQLTIGLILALVYTLLFISLLPEVKMPLLPEDKSNNVFKAALRITILLAIAFLLGGFFSLRNVAWVGFSILVVSQGCLRGTFKKSLERSLGTLVGALVGIAGAHFLFPINMYLITLLCFVLVFLTYFTISYSYALAIGFATVVVGISFYAYHLPISFDQFALSRFADTLIGVSMALAGEYLIFPARHLQTKL